VGGRFGRGRLPRPFRAPLRSRHVARQPGLCLLVRAPGRDRLRLWARNRGSERRISGRSLRPVRHPAGSPSALLRDRMDRRPRRPQLRLARGPGSARRPPGRAAHWPRNRRLGGAFPLPDLLRPAHVGPLRALRLDLRLPRLFHLQPRRGENPGRSQRLAGGARPRRGGDLLPADRHGPDPRSRLGDLPGQDRAQGDPPRPRARGAGGRNRRCRPGLRLDRSGSLAMAAGIAGERLPRHVEGLWPGRGGQRTARNLSRAAGRAGGFPYSLGHWLAELAFFLPCYLLAAWLGVALWRGRTDFGAAERKVFLAAFGALFSYAVFHALVQVDFDWRYRTPILAHLILLAAGGLADLARRGSAR
jgi:hypothetical protein